MNEARPDRDPPTAVARRRTKTFWTAVALALALAACLRFLALDRFPRPVNQDELSNLYDGWALATLGTDRHGAPWPFVLQGFGASDYRPALCAWLIAIPARWSGFSVAAGRAVSAVVGVASLLLAAAWAHRALGRGAALAVIIVASVTPWHLLYSRLAHEGAMLPACFFAAVLLSVRAAADRTARRQSPARRWLLAGALIGLSANAYAATRLTAPLFALLSAILLGYTAIKAGLTGKRITGMLILLFVGFFLGALPQLLSFLESPAQFLGRANTELLRPRGFTTAVITYIRGFLANLDPQYLFAGFGTPNNLTVGRALMILAPFFYFGVFRLFRPSRFLSGVDRWFLLSMLAIAILPSAITRDSPHALRASGLCLVIPLISVTGLWYLVDGLSTRGWRRLATALPYAAALLALTEGLIYVRHYTTSDVLPRVGMQHGLVKLGAWLRDNAEGYDRVCIEPAGEQIDLYVAAYTGMTPAEFRDTPRGVVEIAAFDRCIRLGRYYFMSRLDAARQWNVVGQQERWLVVSADLGFRVVLSR